MAGYTKINTVKVIRTRHRVEIDRRCTVGNVLEFLRNVPTIAKVVEIFYTDDDTIAIEFEEEAAIE